MFEFLIDIALIASAIVIAITTAIVSFSVGYKLTEWLINSSK